MRKSSMRRRWAAAPIYLLCYINHVQWEHRVDLGFGRSLADVRGGDRTAHFERCHAFHDLRKARKVGAGAADSFWGFRLRVELLIQVEEPVEGTQCRKAGRDHSQIGFNDGPYR